MYLKKLVCLFRRALFPNKNRSEKDGESSFLSLSLRSSSSRFCLFLKERFNFSLSLSLSLLFQKLVFCVGKIESKNHIKKRASSLPGRRGTSSSGSTRKRFYAGKQKQKSGGQVTSSHKSQRERENTRVNLCESARKKKHTQREILDNQKSILLE